MHRFGEDPIERKFQVAELDYLAHSRAASQTVAENYAGLDLD